MNDTATAQPAGGDPPRRSLKDAISVRDLFAGGPVAQAVLWLSVAISLFHIWVNSIGNVPELTQNAIHFAGFALLCTLLYPIMGGQTDKPQTVEARPDGPPHRSPHRPPHWSRHWLSRSGDIALGLVVAGAALYVAAAESAVYARGVTLNTADWIAGIICIFGAIELTRRTTGWIIPGIILFALTYVAFWGAHIGGVFRFPGLSPETLLFRSIYGDDALFGTIARISSTFVFMFILFGAFLLKSGAGQFIVDIARAVAGKMTGGPGFVAVIASGLTGTISGSAVANTASTGVITIPLMKRAGFPRHFAGGVEAASSTGGQLMPPIMGAGAFVMASFTQISYTTIVTVSILPAILYFLTVAFFVRIEAKRSNARALAEEEDVPSLSEVFRRGGPPFVLPIGLLIGLLVSGYTPTYAAGFAIATCIAASWLTPNRMGLKEIVGALALGARNMVMTAVLLCAVGLIVNVISTAGIGNTFSLMITTWSAGSLMIALVLIALASLVLGMGLPVTAAYIVLGTLSAPALTQLILQGQLTDLLIAGALPETAKAIFLLAAPDQLAALQGPMAPEAAAALIAALPPETMTLLVQQAFSPEIAAVALLSAHMIVFWLSQDSNVTPPVCLAAFTAAAIAESKPMRTGVAAWKLAKGLYLVPLLFAYTPFLSGDWGEMLTIFGFAIFGLWALSAGIEGYWERPLILPLRLSVLAIGVVLLWPFEPMWKLIALAAMASVFVLHLKYGPKISTRRTVTINET